MRLCVVWLGVVGGMMVIALLAFTMRQVLGRNVTVSLAMGPGSMEVPWKSLAIESQVTCQNEGEPILYEVYF